MSANSTAELAAIRLTEFDVYSRSALLRPHADGYVALGLLLARHHGPRCDRLDTARHSTCPSTFIQVLPANSG